MPGPVVTLTFDGEESGLVSSADRAGSALDDFGDETDSLAQKAEKSGKSFEAIEEGADTAETRFTGFSDVLGGTADVFATLGDESLTTGEKLQALGQAGADLAGGFADFLIPALKSMWTTMISSTAATTALTAAKTGWAAITGVVSTAMTALNTVIKANPMLFLVGLIAVLVTAFLTLWTHSEGFRNFFIGAWNGIKNVVAGVIDFLVRGFNGIIDFFTHFPQRIATALGAIGTIIGDIFKGALNIAIGIINWFIDRANDIIYGINLINPFEDIPSIPKIKKLATGGKALRDGFAFLHEGETVRSAGETARGGAGGGTIEVKGDNNSWLYRMIRQGIKDGKLRLSTS